MTVDSQDQVSREAYDRSLPVPRAFVVTFGNGVHYWANCEDGQRSGPAWLPSWDDVEEFLVGELEE